MNRILHIRKLMGISRNKMQKLYDISASSIERWEKGQIPSKKNCYKLIAAAASAGIECNYDWLVFGHGAEPIIAPKVQAPNAVLDIYKALTKNNKLALYLVTDNAMYPKITAGSWLITQMIPIKYAHILNNHICLVETLEHKIVRLIKISEEPNIFDLLTTNYVPKSNNLYNQKLVTISRIIYIYNG